MFEIYEGRTGANRKKSYLIFKEKDGFTYARQQARKHFKCTDDHIDSPFGWVVNDELYLGKNPKISGAKKVIVAYWIK